MSATGVDLASLLCSKLCHDLLNPVGAINNGLELLEDETDPVMRDKCLELVADSATASANKLKYYRLAFGAAGGYGDTVDPAEARALIETLVGNTGKIELGWAVQAEVLPKKAVKVLLNLALIGREALVRGGQLDVGAEVTGRGVEVVVRASGDRVIIDENIRAALDGELAEAALEPRTAPAYLVRMMALEAGGDLRISPPDPKELLLGAIVTG
ncbi:MAG: histidine phosphotransferase family protein [Parasphingorhabdus sp.]|nr:histidine phosphotransferase family protein [Parasphingorhabdus sp.]